MKGKKKMFLLTIVVIITTLIIVSLIQFNQRMVIAKATLESYNTKTFEASMGTIEYSITGTGETILMLHGITGGIDQGANLAEAYLTRGYQVICVSRFGYLQSDLPENATASLQADAYSELLKELGIDKAVIVADSAGATSAYEFGANYPDQCDALVILSGAVPSQEEYPLPPKFVAKTIFSSDYIYFMMTKVSRNTMLKQTGTPETILSKLSNEEKNRLLEGTILSALPIEKRTTGILFDMFTSNLSVNQSNLEAIKVPTLFIVAEDDSFINFQDTERAVERIDNAQLIKIKSGGHTFLDSEDKVKDYIDDFLKRNCNITPKI